MTETAADEARTESDDRRPPIWTGHLGPLTVADLAASKAFYQTVGLRLAVDLDHLVSLEMRGGTHLVLVPVDGDDPVDPVDAPFDFMVEDLPATHRDLTEAGLPVTEIEASGAHHRFTLSDPDGHRIRVHDSHVVGPV